MNGEVENKFSSESYLESLDFIACVLKHIGLKTHLAEIFKLSTQIDELIYGIDYYWEKNKYIFETTPQHDECKNGQKYCRLYKKTNVKFSLTYNAKLNAYNLMRMNWLLLSGQPPQDILQCIRESIYKATSILPKAAHEYDELYEKIPVICSIIQNFTLLLLGIKLDLYWFIATFITRIEDELATRIHSRLTWKHEYHISVSIYYDN